MSADWKYAAASVAGTSHQRTGEGVCQDAHRCILARDVDRLICVVSDGAGSAERSAEASRIVCERAASLLYQVPEEQLHTEAYARDTVAGLRYDLQALAEQADLPLRQFACTLLVSVVTSEIFTSWQLGDGAVCFREVGGHEYRVALWPSKGEYANTTYFITDENAHGELQWVSHEIEVADVAVFSDGLERLALDFSTRSAHNKFFSGLFPYLYNEAGGEATAIQDQLARFLASDRVNAKTDDDKTLVLATRYCP